MVSLILINRQGQVLERSFEDSVDLEDSIELDSVKTSTPSISTVETTTTATTSTTTTSSSTPSVETMDLVIETIKPTTPENYGNVADKCAVSTLIQRVELKSVTNTVNAGKNSNAVHVGLSPRLEMRLALNQDIMGDEDLISYNPGPDLTTILGHDLSSYHRMTGKDIIMNRIVNRQQPNYSQMGGNVNAMIGSNSSIGISTSTHVSHVNTHPYHQHHHHHNHKDVTNSYCQQNNSKMDTPTPNRKKSTNHSTWNNFGSVDRGRAT